MSWSMSRKYGKPAALRSLVIEELERCARPYDGKTEAKDVASARDAIVSFLDEAVCNENEAVYVEASGSRGWSLSITIQCGKITLELGEPAKLPEPTTPPPAA